MHLAKFAVAFDSGHTGLAHLDPGDWGGLGAEAFRAKFTAQPAKWAHAATACADAGLALESYAETLDWARGQAEEAVRLWKRGVAARKAAAEAYNATIDRYQDDITAYNDKVDDGEDPGSLPTAPPAFSDPGAHDKQAAKDTLDAARKQRDTAASHAEAAVKAATELAPPKPEFTDRMQNDFGDVGKALPIAGEHFVGGLVRSGTDIVKFARGLNPYDPYNMTHPAQYLTHLNATAAGLVDMTQHPERLPAAVLGTGWGSDGSEAGGRLIGNVLLTIATDGGGTAAKAAAESAAKNAAKDAGEGAAKNAATVAAEDPAKAAIENAAKKTVSDPIDIATGDMVLSQTDITLPGTLPLVLGRTHLSSYGVGRLFGRSWASTLDQRLELDDKGVAFVGHDGAIVLYPVPQPGVPALPVHGPRWPLLWDGTPGSPLCITDTSTGRTHHFAAASDALGAPGGGTLLPLTEVRDANGNGYEISHDADGIPTEVRHSGGYRLTLDSQDGRITALRLVDPAGGPSVLVGSFGFDTAGNLTETTDSSSVPYRFTYDSGARLTSWTDRNASTYRYQYDARGRCVATHGPDGFLSSTLDSDDTTRTTTFTDSLGHRRTYTHNAAYRLIAETDPLGNITRYERDDDDQLLSRTDALGRTTAYQYNESGYLSEVVRPDGRRTRIEYNEANLPVKVTRPDGNFTRETYDERGNRTSSATPSGQVTHYTRDAAGHLTAVTDPLGNVTAVRCDQAGLLVEVIDPLGAVTRYDRDAFGRPTAITDPTGAVTRLEWTVEGRLARRAAPDGTTESWTYDGEGNRVSHHDATGGVTRFEYTDFDLVSARTDPDGVRHEFVHDTELRLTQVINPQGMTWSYRYDPVGRLIEESDFDNRSIGYSHDAAGHLTSRTDSLGQTITYQRNAIGQVIRKDAGGKVTTYAYDLTDELARAEGQDVTLSRARDRYGRLQSETVNGRTLTYAYDSLGRRTGRTTPTGATTEWAYDAAGNHERMVASGRTIDFSAGRELSRQIAGFVTLTNEFDEAGRLATQSVTATTDARTVQRRSYTYRSDGHLTGVDDLLAGPSRLDLDTAGRVTAVQAENWSETYTYDAAGNQASASWPAGHPGSEATGPRTYAGTRITQAGRVRYEHDALGRVTLRQKSRLSRKPETWRYEWDAEDRLTSVTTPDNTRWRYSYDALGRRTAKARLAPDGESVVEEIVFTWDGSTLCEQTTLDAELPRPVTLTWDHQGLRPVAQTERIAATGLPQEEVDTRFFAIVTDLVGAPSELVDEHGDIAWRTRSTLWGTTAWATGSTAYTPLRFPGQYFDPETGLHYNYFRHYDPETARYLSVDPLGLEVAANPTAYVHNPLTWSDPLGLAPCGPIQDYRPTAPSFAVGSDGVAQDLRSLGRPDNEFVYSGHGGIRVGDGTPVTVPEGTSLHMYSHHGETISDRLGNKIETGSPTPVEVYGPGEQLPNYTLFPPDGLNILGTPRNLTVTRPFSLSELLQPNMGNVHWAACRSVIGIG
jgi:RHS repeat-associated protein